MSQVYTTDEEIDVAREGLVKGGEFWSFSCWVNKAKSWIGGTGARCYDAKGRRCRIGEDMMRARDEDAFPVKYYFSRGRGFL